MYCPLVGKQEKQISKVTTVNTRAKYYRRFTEEVLTELVLKKHFDFCHMDKWAYREKTDVYIQRKKKI